MSFNPNVSDSASNNTYTQRKVPNLTKPVSEKRETGNKLYQKYRKLFENEKKETDKLRRQVALQATDYKKLKASNSIL